MANTIMLYWFLMFLVIGIIEMIIIISAFFAQTNLKRKGFRTNLIPIVIVIGLLLFITSLVLGVSFVSAVTNEAKKEQITSIKQDMGSTSETINDLLTEMSRLREENDNDDGLQMYGDTSKDMEIRQLEGRVYSLKGKLTDMQDKMDDLESELERMYAIIPSGHY